MFRKLLNSIRSRKLDADIREELAFHRAQTAGSFGNATLLQEQAREAGTLVWLVTILQDLRYGLRQLFRTPMVSAAAILSLAFGIGANTAIFSLVNAVLLRSLPVTNPEELSLLVKANREGGRGNFSHPFTRVLTNSAQSFAGVLATGQPGRVKISINSVEQRVTAETVSANYFEVLGVAPLAGRFFTQNEDEPGAPDSAVISHTFWQRRFGLDPAIVGKTFEKDHYLYTIVGVAPPEFFGISAGSSVDLWITFSRVPPRLLHNPGMNYLQMLARRKPEVSVESAQAEADTILQNHNREFTSGPRVTGRERQLILSTRIVLEPGSTGLASLRQQYSKPLRLLQAITALVLLIACANIANLLLARGAARSKEIGMRLAIGASRKRMIRQLLTESLLLAGLGGSLAVGLAYAGATILVNLMSAGRGDNRLWLDLAPDWRIFGFNASVGIVVGLLFGLLPAVRSISAASVNDRSATSQSHRPRLGKLLIAFQVTLTMVLVFGSALFLRTLNNLQSVPLGFQPNGLYRADLDFERGFPEDSKPEVFAQMLERMPQTSGVQSAALCQPFGGGWTNDVVIPSFSTTERPSVFRYQVSPGFFNTMRIAVVEGRDFSRQDTPGGPRAVIVNRTLASRYFAGRDPIGQHIQFPRDETPSQVVGIVADTRVQGVRNEFPAIAYTALAQGRNVPIFIAPSLMLRLNGPVPDLAQKFREIQPAVRYEGGGYVTEQLRGQLRQERILALLSTFFGGLAMLLAAIGLFGNLSYVLACRKTEIGVRLALGAEPLRLVTSVIREYGIVVAAGLGGGVLASFALSGLVRQFLFGIEPSDPIAIAAAAAILFVVGLTAVFIPARRASLADPLDALRGE